MVSLKEVIHRVRHRRHRRHIVSSISNPNSNFRFGRNNTRRSLSVSTSSPRNRTPSNADSPNVAVCDRTYSDINPNDTRVLLRLNSSEDSADSTDVVQLSSTTDFLQVTAHDEEPIVFSPLKSNKWWMERGIRDSRKAVENSARRLQFGLTEGAAEFGEQHKKGLKEALGNLGEKHKQGLKEAFATFGEKHKEGMKKAAGKIGDKFISGSSSLGFFIFLTASVTVHGTIFTIDVLCLSVFMMCIFWFSNADHS